MPGAMPGMDQIGFSDASDGLFDRAAGTAVHPAAPTGLQAVDAKGRLPSYIKDHRTRLRQRFVTGGPEAVPDYELLELVLFRAIPRQDVKPLARKLLDRFGSFAAVMAAAPARLAEVHGVGAAVVTELKVVGPSAPSWSRGRHRVQDGRGPRDTYG